MDKLYEEKQGDLLTDLGDTRENRTNAVNVRKMKSNGQKPTPHTSQK